MLNTYLKLALRQLRKHPLYSAINILGLSFGVAIFLVLSCYISFETSYNSYHEKADHVYQLNTTLYSLDLDNYTAWDVGPEMKKSVPGVKDFARYHWSYGELTLKGDGTENKSYEQTDIILADNSIFSLLTFKPVAGDLSNALSSPYTIVLSRSLAGKFFDDPTKAIGNTIAFKCEWFSADLLVTAVIEDSPRNTTVSYNSFVSIGPLIQTQFYQTERRWNNFFTLIELEDGASANEVSKVFPAFISEYKSGEKLTYKPEMYLQPLLDVHLSNRDPRQGKDMSNIYLFMAVAIIIISIAWVNYVNLSTARAMERAKEVGVKKALGVLRKHLITQFMMESLMVNVFSLVIAVVLAFLFMPVLNELAEQEFILDLTSKTQILTLLGLLGFGTLVSGLYPAIILSSFRTTEVIKGTNTLQAGGFSLRKGLIVFQFTASLSLLICTSAIIQQVDFMKEQDKGVSTEQVLVIQGPSNVIENPEQDANLNQRTISFKNKLSSLPSVEAVATSGVVPGGSYNHSTHMDVIGKSDEEIKPGENTYLFFADMDFLSVYSMNILEGRGWDSKRRTDLNNVLVNEAMVADFKLGTNKDAIDKKIVVLHDTMNIIGVVKNFYWESLKVNHHPIVIYPFDVMSRRISMRVNVNSDVEATINSVHKLYDEYFPGNEFYYYFANDFYNRLYASDLRFGAIFGVFTFFAMVVACLGLFGMATFTTYQRSKEISIRKVLGASISNIMLLLSTQFGKLLMIAIALSVPLSWMVINNWLEGYPVRMSLSFWLFAIPSIALLVMLTVSVVVQVYRGANVNPARILKN